MSAGTGWAGVECERLEARIAELKAERDDWKSDYDLMERRYLGANERCDYMEARGRDLEAALRLAARAFAQYAYADNEPTEQVVDDTVEGFMQDAELRAVGREARRG